MLVNHVLYVVVAVRRAHILVQGVPDKLTEWCFRLSGNVLVRIVAFKELPSKFPCTLAEAVRATQKGAVHPRWWL